MVRIQLSSLHEFIASLSRLDYEEAKLASGRVMEDHIQMGALMFSLLTIEMMYTSMDYLTPANFRRGNSYLLNMYSPLPRRLNKLLKKIELEYEEEHERLVSQCAWSSAHAEPSAFSRAVGANGDASFAYPSHIEYIGEGDLPVHSTAEFSDYRTLGTDPNMIQASGRPHGSVSAFRAAGAPYAAMNLSEHRRRLGGEHKLGAINSGVDHEGRSGAGSAERFDSNHYMNNMDEAEKVLQELETVKQLVSFIYKFVEVRKTMVVLYRFIAVTGPVLYVHRLGIMLNRCTTVLQTIIPNSLYASLLDHVHKEVLLVRSLVDWNSHIVCHSFVQAIASMKGSKAQLKIWQESLPATATVPAANKPAQASENARASHSLLYAAFAKSSRLVQNLLWGDSNHGAASSNKGPTSGRARGVVVWISCWTDFLTFKTTAYFQRLIAPHRSLYHEDVSASARQVAVLDDIWTRPGLSSTNLHDMVTTFMQTNDCLFVTLLFESSKQRPFALDGFAIAGTKVKVPDYRVQACSVLFCMSNQKLLQARGRFLQDSLVSELYAKSAHATSVAAPTAATTRSDSRSDSRSDLQQLDEEWFRKKCLPDILCVLDSDRTTLDLELLGSSPLLGQLGSETDDLLIELSISVDEVIEAALVQLADEELDIADVTGDGSEEWPVSDSRHDDRRQFDAMLGLESPSIDTPNYVDTGGASKNAELQSGISAAEVQPYADKDGQDSRNGLEELDRGTMVRPANHIVDTPDSTEAMQTHDENLSLYSTYLLKSHLRNNMPHDWKARNVHGGRHFVGRQSGRAPTMVSGRSQQDLAQYNANSVVSYQGREPSDARGSVAACPVLERRNTDGVRSIPGHGPDARSAADRPLTVHEASDGSSAFGNPPAVRVEPWAAEEMARQRRQPGGLVSGPESLLDLNARTSGSSPNGHRVRGTIGSLSSSNVRTARPALSIRSLFQSSPRLSLSARHQQATESRADNGEVARRVHCGERLKDLFGPWDARSDDEQPSDGLGGASMGGNSQRGSVRSLPLSTQMRVSIRNKSMAATAAAANTAAAMVMPNAETGGGGFSRRVSRVAAPLVTSTHLATSSSRPGMEPVLGQGRQQRPSIQRGQPARPLLSQHIPEASSMHSMVPPPVSATMAGGLESCTYMYSRASLPNIFVVAVMLDTERGLGRRREAERAWGEIVDAVRGTPTFDLLQALPS